MQQGWRRRAESSIGSVPVKHHAVIAGTGRAGTSFLVDVLRDSGVPTAGLSISAEHERARAGLERALTVECDSYLVKDPWLHEYANELDLSLIEIDALIVPVRSLAAAAMSRVRLERASLLDGNPRSADWSSFGLTPGGLVYSLSVSDQERVLAVGQARLIHWAVSNEVPLFLLSYPRLVRDPEYLVDSLWSWLQQFTDRESAIQIARGKSAPRDWESDDDKLDEFVPRDQHLSVTARKETVELLLSEKMVELDRRNVEISDLGRRLEESSNLVDALSQRIAALEGELSAASRVEEVQFLLRAELQRRDEEVRSLLYLQQDLESARSEVAILGKDLEFSRWETETVRREFDSMSGRLDDAQARLSQLEGAASSSQAEVRALRRSRSYRIGSTLTAPVRWGRRLRGVTSPTEA